MLLFIDVDAVLLGKKNPSDVHQTLASGCEDFIDYALNNFECYWLTSHCRGSTEPVLNYLQPYTTPSLRSKLEQINATNYKTFKTEALHGDFLWIDDSPTAYEIDYLDKRDWLNRWLQVNTRQDFHGLEKLLLFLKTEKRSV